MTDTPAMSTVKVNTAAENTAAGNGWIASVPPEHATGVLAQAYQSQLDKIGKVTELTQIGSLYPDLVHARLHLYAVVDATPSAVPDHVRRAVALLTSVLNGCQFCTVGHTEKLAAAGHGDLARAIKDDPDGATAGDPAADVALRYAKKLVTDPRHITEGDVAALREAGWGDLDILDINNIAAYYSYINRVAAGLGLHREA